MNYRTILREKEKRKMGSRYQSIKYFLLGVSVCSVMMLSLQQKCINKWKKAAQKNRGLFRLMDQWTNIKQEGKHLDMYFIKNNYKNIAIYGMGYVGIRLAKELKGSKIKIVYGIDRNADNIYSDVKVITMDNKLSKVDAIVVTVMDEFDEVSEMLSEKVGCAIIAIEDIINEI